MQKERKVKILGDIIMGEGCSFEDLSRDIFGCFQKHDAVPNFRLYEMLQSEEEIQHSSNMKNIIERAIEKRKNKTD